MKEKLKRIVTWPDFISDALIIGGTGYALLYGLNETIYAYWISWFLFVAILLVLPYDVKKALETKEQSFGE